MAVSERKLLEREINIYISKKIEADGYLVIRELRLHPCEMDIVAFDPISLQLMAVEIKRCNWQAVLSQAIRAKLYCHLACAVLPISMQGTVPQEEFSRHGVGLAFYSEKPGPGIDLSISELPRTSDIINRSLKQLVYKKFHSRFGDMVHAA